MTKVRQECAKRGKGRLDAPVGERGLDSGTDDTLKRRGAAVVDKGKCDGEHAFLEGKHSKAAVGGRLFRQGFPGKIRVEKREKMRLARAEVSLQKASRSVGLTEPAGEDIEMPPDLVGNDETPDNPFRLGATLLNPNDRLYGWSGDQIADREFFKAFCHADGSILLRTSRSLPYRGLCSG